MSHREGKTLFLFAGEQSGDLLGGNLIQALKQVAPSLSFKGIGGSHMQQAGLDRFLSMERFQVMGFVNVLYSLPRLYVDFKKIHKEITQSNPAAVILIDYPDFNMRLASKLRKQGYKGKIIHYVCPSVWAWRKKRIHHLARTLDHLLAILPFEPPFFSKTPLPVTFVGHPLVTMIDQYSPTSHTFSKPLIAIFPGSRAHEIASNLPIQLEAANRLGTTYQIAISVARPELQDLIQRYASPGALLVPCEKRYELMRAATCALATSGTIVLELGLHHVPTVVTYQLSPTNYYLGRYFFRIYLTHYTLVNIICGQEVFPEFVHKRLSPDSIAKSLKHLIEKPERCLKECTRLRELLTTQDASLNAANTILKVIA
jgi:lipid-A-disaccharide synthase